MNLLASSIAYLLIPAALALSVGDTAPDLTAKNQDGKVVHIGDHKGRFVLLYFYPKDETPGCTTEACTLRDKYDKIKALNAVVLGVSRQDAASHKKFIANHKLPFDLLTDADGAIGKAYGVESIPILGFSKRESILIGPDGKVLKHYVDVNPESHANEVLADIEAAKAKK